MNEAPDPVVISGVGMICPLGQDAPTAFSRMLRGESVAEPLPEAWLGHGQYRSRLWAPLPDIDFSRYGLGRGDPLRYDRVSMMAIGACHEALDHAALTLEPRDTRAGSYRIAGVDPARTGVYIGTGIGGINTTLGTHLFHAMKGVRDELASIAADRGDDPGQVAQIAARIRLDRRFNPLAVTMLMSNAVSAAPAVRFGVTGPCRTATLACASGTVAIGDAWRALDEGHVDLAIAGAAEYLYDDYGSIFRAYDITGALASGIDDPARANRPFDEARGGFLFSEGGAAVVILERASSAAARGVAPLAEIAAFAESFDGHDLIAMDESGAGIRDMIARALAQAGLDPSAVDYVNAHGTGTEMNDRIELAVLDELFGARPLVNSTKGLIGHAIGASGAIETVVTALSLHEGRVHPCVNLDAPIRPMNFPRRETAVPIEVALTESFAFGGHNACLLLKRPRTARH